MHAILVGLGLAAGSGAQIGSMSLFQIRSTLRNGWGVGLAIGLGIALVDGLYAAAGAAGVAPLLQVEPLRLVLGLAGAVVLVWLARGRSGARGASEQAVRCPQTRRPHAARSSPHSGRRPRTY